MDDFRWTESPDSRLALDTPRFMVRVAVEHPETLGTCVDYYDWAGAPDVTSVLGAARERWPGADLAVFVSADDEAELLLVHGTQDVGRYTSYTIAFER